MQRSKQGGKPDDDVVGDRAEAWARRRGVKILVYLAHPRPDRSQVNQPMFEAAQSIDGISTIDLYATYPTFDIDVAQEQARLAAHEVIVFLHPLYWGSAPALLKEWIDQVFDYGRPWRGRRREAMARSWSMR